MEAFALFTEGDFGDAVAGRLATVVPRLRVQSIVMNKASMRSHVSGSAFVGVALWRRYPEEADRLDGVCHEAGIPWSGVMLDGTSLQCGPVIVPGEGPCYTCYRKRRAAHQRFPEREHAIDAAYATDPALGIPGFTPSSVRIAVAALLLDQAERRMAAGRIRSIDLLQGVVEEARVVPVHGCARCGRRWPAGERYVRALIDALAEHPP
jgi:bacteriocin biosynthesis cyclodehydratase domain-containing protein